MIQSQSLKKSYVDIDFLKTLHINDLRKSHLT